MKKNIKIEESTKQKLDSLNNGEMTYDEIIVSLLPEGSIESLENISREKIVFELQYKGYDAHGNVDDTTVSSVSWEELKSSHVGDVFQAEPMNHMDCYIESAEVLFNDEKSCIVRFCDLEITETDENKNYEVVVFHYF